MKILVRQHIGTDVAALSSNKWSTKYHPYIMKYISDNVYSLEFEFIFENEADKKDYWLKIWRLQKNINSINYCIEKFLEP